MENETEADTAMLATELGYDSETVEKYRRIALLHDVGKFENLNRLREDNMIANE